MSDYRYQKNLAKKKGLGLVFYLSLFLLLGGGGVIGISHLVLNTKFFKVSSIKAPAGLTMLDDVFISDLERRIIGSSKALAMLGSDNVLFWKLANVNGLGFISGFSSLEVDSDIFNRKIIISGEERDIFGIWCSNGKCLGFDEEGIVFSEAPDVDGFLILKIQDENVRNVSLGGLVLPKKEWITNILNTVKILSDKRTAISSIKIRDLSLEEWEMQVLGLKFYFSLNFVPENLGDIVQKLDKKLSLDKLSYIDFRIPSRIYYR